jgi:hypothetical protein
MTREQRLLGAARMCLANEPNWFCLLRSAVGAYKETNMGDPAQESLDGSPATVDIFDEGGETWAHIRFQCGPVKEVGENGTTIEAVIDVLVKRLEGFQKGAFKCRENESAIFHLLGAKHSLEARTKGRKERGVEGTNQP